MFRDGFAEMPEKVRREVSSRLNLAEDLDDEEIRQVITQVVLERSAEHYLSLSRKQELISLVFNSMRRLDVIQPLIDDDSITEIMINGPEDIFVERDGRISRLEIKFDNTEKLDNVIQSIVSKVNRVVNEASPVVDARLQDGSRVCIVLPPVALKGPVVTIRKFPDKPITVEKMIENGTLSQEAAEMLQQLVRARYNIFVSGGTGSGKTTFLNAISNFIPSCERVVTIEDSAELRLHNIENLVSLETRNANTEGRGEITVRDLIKTSLRMRPDRIVVGEVRGVEALDMLQAMNTGHDGSLSTGHANTTGDMLSRLETMVLSAAPLPVEVIRKQIAAALDIIIHLGRLRDGSRRVLEICEIAGFTEGEIVLNNLFRFQETGESDNRVIGSLRKTACVVTKTQKLQMAGLKTGL